MSELATFKNPEGFEFSTGLIMPDDNQKALMNAVEEYPDSMMLDDPDIEKLLKDYDYKQSRRDLAPYMINQSSVGKCNTSAVVGAVDQLRLQQGLPHIPLADDQLYMRVNGGRDAGSALIEGYRELLERGVAPRFVQVGGMTKAFPHFKIRQRDIPSDIWQAAMSEMSRFRGFEWYRAPLDRAGYARALASALARRQPVVFAWHVGNNGMRLRNGYAQISRGPGNHANVFHSAKYVGGQDIVHPDDRNSWGPSKDVIYGPTNSGWGEAGYALFTMDDAFACAGNHYTYIGTSVRPDPTNDFGV